MKFKGKEIVLLGLKGSGKSNFLKAAISQRPSHLVFDPVREYEGFHRYIPDATRGDEAVEELAMVTDKVLLPNKDVIDHFAVDEVNRFVTKGGELKGPVGELVDLNRHYELGIWFIARLPQQLPTEIRELADYIFIFKLAGKASKDFLDDMGEGTLDKMEQMEEHECIMLGPDRQPKIVKPVWNMDRIEPEFDVDIVEEEE